MSASELFPTIEALPSIEKFKLLQFLVTALGEEAGFLPLDPKATYSVWTPYFVPQETVTKMEQMLAEGMASDAT